jgi:8-oxo-dGTP pyrophosphatase MutT (NUDIX family)
MIHGCRSASNRKRRNDKTTASLLSLVLAMVWSEPSLLHAVLRCDKLQDDPSSCPYYAQSADLLDIDGTVIGWMHGRCYEKLKSIPDAAVFFEFRKTSNRPQVSRCVDSYADDSQAKTAWGQSVQTNLGQLSSENIPPGSMDSFNKLTTTAKRLTILVAAIVAEWRQQKAFPPLEGWRNEMYIIYNRRRQPCFMLERAACGLFGVVTYGAHLNAFIAPGPLQIDASIQQIKAHRRSTRVWCPRRSVTKATFPGMLDNTVAGGISNGLSPFETIVKEAEEEASIPTEFARLATIPAGCISYMYADGIPSPEGGYIQPEVQYIYDMELTAPDMKDAIIPRPNDGESEDFELLDCNEILDLIRRGCFKPNCALVLIDFMIRRGILDEEDDRDFLEIQSRMHRRLPFPTR